MKISRLFSDKIFDFPLQTNKYFPDHLEYIFKRYKVLLASVDDDYSDIIREHRDNISDISANILLIVNLIYSGKSIEAYEKLNTLMARLKDQLVPPNSKNVVIQNGHYFKARPSNGGEYERQDMFHVPFEQRYKVSTNRFSIPGLPCLYLSDSIFTCWHELNNPLFSQMAVSRFKEVGINMKYLELMPDYTYFKIVHNSKSKDMQKLARDSISFLPRSLTLYPLLAACYTSVKDVKSVFKPEYIIPQLLMQWVMTQDYLHGIKYLSTRCPQVKDSTSRFWDTPINYAIPVKSVSDKGYCSFLSSHFMLTNPISWELLTIINPRLEFKDVEEHQLIDVIKRHKYEIKGLGSLLYSESAFGLLQTQTYHMPFDFLNK